MWVQEEPRNMGARSFIASRYYSSLIEGRRLTVASRAESASPATGSGAAHRLEQQMLLSEAFGQKVQPRPEPEVAGRR